MHEAKAIKKKKRENLKKVQSSQMKVLGPDDGAVLGRATLSHKPLKPDGAMQVPSHQMGTAWTPLFFFVFVFLHIWGLGASISYPPRRDPGASFLNLQNLCFLFYSSQW